MRSYEPPKGPLPLLATVLFVVGLALASLLGKPWTWIGIVVMVAGVLLSISLLVAQARSKPR